MNEEREQDGADEGEALLSAYHEAMEQGRLEQAEAIALQFCEFACRQSEKQPGEYLPLRQEAHRQEFQAQWHEAEAAYRRTLELAQTRKNDMPCYKAHDDLCRLYSLLGQHERALSEAQAAVEAARRSQGTTLLTMSLTSLAWCSLKVGDVDTACGAAEEILQNVSEEAMFNLQRAQGLILRARCRLERKQEAETQEDLDAAWNLLAPQSAPSMFAGIHSALAGWWETMARLRSFQADFEGAVEARKQAVERRRLVSQMPQLEGPYKFNSLAAALYKLGQAYFAVEDVDAAMQAFTESRSIRQSIGLPAFGANVA